MTTQRFSHTQYPVQSLLSQIQANILSLPDLQRPFVWKRAKVRDLFDSLYHGYPAGYFLFWTTNGEVDSHGVGGATGTGAPLKMIVDGQQRLTSLYLVMTGSPIEQGDGTLQEIKISFNPLTEEFAVADATKEHDPEWLANISHIWTNSVGAWQFTSDFLKRLGASREITPEIERAVGENLARLHSLLNYQFSALDLEGDLDIDEVAEIFVRINSTGSPLNSADFILTLMSVHHKEARHRLEDFALQALKPSTSKASPYNHFHTPSPDELLRVAVGYGLGRGVLQNAYQALRGRDPKTGMVSSELRNERFAELIDAQEKVLDLINWHDFMVAIKRAGYRSGQMLTSANAFLYSYLLFLIGRHRYGVGNSELREVIARWFFMSTLTGRYTGSPETMIEADLRRFDEASSSEDFVAVLDSVIATQLTEDFWRVTLPDLLDSSAAWSPYLFGYYASLYLLDAKALFSNMRLSELFEPGQKTVKSPVERHHLFPKAYLSTIGITGSTRTNQIANFAFIEWHDNIAISAKPPAEYFPEYFAKLAPTDRDEAMFWHALPPHWESMEYGEFLAQRRSLMSRVIQHAFALLQSGGTGTKPVSASSKPSVDELLHQMETSQVEFKSSARVSLENDLPEKVINEGIVKTVAGFMNSIGGTLAIGISDSGDILGIQPDLDFKHQDIDAFQNWLTTLLMNSIGSGAVGAHVAIRLEGVGSEIVCLVDVEPSASPVYAKTTKGDACFYVRANNTTRMFEGPEIQNYIAGHWK